MDQFGDGHTTTTPTSKCGPIMAPKTELKPGALTCCSFSWNVLHPPTPGFSLTSFRLCQVLPPLPHLRGHPVRWHHLNRGSLPPVILSSLLASCFFEAATTYRICYFVCSWSPPWNWKLCRAGVQVFYSPLWSQHLEKRLAHGRFSACGCWMNAWLIRRRKVCGYLERGASRPHHWC